MNNALFSGIIRTLIIALFLVYAPHFLLSQQSGEYESIITVKFTDDATAAKINQITSSLNLVELRRTRSNFIDYQMPPAADPMTIASLLEDMDKVEAVQLNVQGQIFGEPNDEQVDLQWHISTLNLPDVWDINTGSEEIIVAVIDTGIDLDHPDIADGTDGYNNLYANPKEDAWTNSNNPNTGNSNDDDGNDLPDDWRGWNFVTNTNDVNDVDGHGTTMAGLIAAKTNNGIGIAGVAGGFGTPGVRILPIVWSNGGVNEPGLSSNLTHAIDYAVDQGAHIINMSLGFPTMDSNPDNYPAISAAIERALAQGVILIAATGNRNVQPMSFPASHPHVISINAINENEDAIGNFGSPPEEPVDSRYLLDFVAPGISIHSTTSGGGYLLSDGTSQATAITSGVVALMMNTDVCLSNNEVLDLLKGTAIRLREMIPNQPSEINNVDYDAYNDPLNRRSERYGFGLINPLAALQQIESRVLTLPASGIQVVSTDRSVPNDLIIPSGVELIIQAGGTLNVAPDRRIIVERGAKLIVDGGKITTCRSDKWKGIYVLGNSTRPQPSDPATPLAPDDSGVLWVKNGGTIENARNAVYTKHPDQSWLSEYWGALIVAEDAFFTNNRRAVEFMQYTDDNNSRFTNTDFVFNDDEANLAAVTIWDTDDILFEDCLFQGYETAVLASDAGCRVINCNLTDCVYGLEIFATSPVSSGAPMTITGNTFSNIDRDAISSHTSGIPKRLEIQTNSFINTDFAVYMNGENDFLMVDNIVTNATVAVNTVNTGKGVSAVNCNSMDLHYYSVAAVGDCSGLQVLDNGFEAYVSDISVWETPNQQIGKLAPSQGAQQMPAINCFSPGGAQHLEMYGAAEPFTYYVPENTPPTDCRIPASSGGNNILETSTELSVACDRPFTGPGEDKNAYLDLLNQYNDRLARGGGVEQLGTSISTYDLRRQLRAGLQQWLRNGLTNGVNSDLEDILIATDPVAGLRQLYGLHLQRGEWLLAQQHLNQLAQEADNNDFVAVQTINLARLQSNSGPFEPSSQQWVTLETLSSRNTDAGNHAKALLSLLRGDHFPAALPYAPQALQIAPANNTAATSTKPRITPNPAQGIANIQDLVYSENEGLIRIVDQLGRGLWQGTYQATTQVQIDLSNLPKGLYFVSVIDGNAHHHTLSLLVEH